MTIKPPTTALLLFLLTACANPSQKPTAPSLPTSRQPTPPATLPIANFESPTESSLTWTPFDPATTQPADPAATQPAPPFSRSSLRPHAGLWSERLSLPRSPTGKSGGELTKAFDPPLNLGRQNLLSAQITHLAAAPRNGEWVASLALTDAHDKHLESDAFPITSRWESVPFNLTAAFEEGLDISKITSISLVLRPATAASPEEPLDIQTDSWTAESRAKSYQGTRTPPPPAPTAEGAPPPPPKFFVEASANTLRLGTPGLYELAIPESGLPSDGRPPRPILRISNPQGQLCGAPHTGLLLLDPTSLAQLGPLNRTPDDNPAIATPNLSATSWPLRPFKEGADNTPARTTWQVVWTSPIAALIELKQEVGPYDNLGEPAHLLTWRIMAYQWGQLFIHAEWPRNPNAAAEPVTWALALDAAALEKTETLSPANERLLADIYPAALRQNLASALPHAMQRGAPVGMIARTLSTSKDAWWWTAASADDRTYKLFGNALPPAPPDSARRRADAMLLANSPNPLMKAGAFGSYLVPPKLLFKQGELDRTFPGDADNDGFVESYGFQTVRLAAGRASFTIYPQNRPVFYPAFLFTIPATERDALNLPKSRLLINLDGKQFADPPQFPDGSFLLQFPYTLDRPVTVEALLIPK